MDKKKIISELKNIFLNKEQKFIDSKSGDMIVRVDADDFAVDLPLFIVNEDGVIPAEDGDYVIEDGRMLVVTNGIITKIKEAEPTPTEEPVGEQKEEMAEPTQAEPTPTEPSVTMEDVVNKINEVVHLINELSDRVDALEGNQAEFTEKSEKIEKYSEKLEETLKNTPANLEKIDLKSVKDTVNETTQTIKERNLMELKSIRSKK